MSKHLAIFTTFLERLHLEDTINIALRVVDYKPEVRSQTACIYNHRLAATLYLEISDQHA